MIVDVSKLAGGHGPLLKLIDFGIATTGTAHFCCIACCAMTVCQLCNDSLPAHMHSLSLCNCQKIHCWTAVAQGFAGWLKQAFNTETCCSIVLYATDLVKCNQYSITVQYSVCDIDQHGTLSTSMNPTKKHMQLEISG